MLSVWTNLSFLSSDKDLNSKREVYFLKGKKPRELHIKLFIDCIVFNAVFTLF